MPYKCFHCDAEVTHLNAYCDIRVEGEFSFERENTTTDEHEVQNTLRHIDESDWIYTCPECSEDIYDPADCLVEEEDDDEEEEPEEEEEPDLVGNDSQSANNVSNTDKTKDTPNNIAFCRCGSLYLTTYKRETRCPNCYA